jgi:AcrR family transcriptional regulator
MAARRRDANERPKKRRTQAERREGTIRKLLDAATRVLIEQGYAEASVQRICARAGVSQGALFRHFPTREALLVAVGEDVGGKLLERYRRDFESLDARSSDAQIASALRLVRDACRSRLNQAWFELATAARTHESLRTALEPAAARYHDAIEHLARNLLPDLARSLGDHFSVLVDTVLAVFDGEVVHRWVVKKPALEDRRLELLAGVVPMLRRAGVT